MPSCGKLSQIVKAIRRKRESQMLIRERAAIGARAYNADVLRQKAREWVAKSAVNRIREDPEGAQVKSIAPFQDFLLFQCKELPMPAARQHRKS